MGSSNGMTISCGLLGILFLACCSLCEAAPGSVPALYVLGDSQADAGNNNYLVTLIKANFPHNGIDYPGHMATGRFSNGYNFVDFLAGNLKLPSPPPYLSMCYISGCNLTYLNGFNFASGGAGVSVLTNMGQCISFDDQIDHHYSSVYASLVQQLGQTQASAHLARSIFAVAIGGNDINSHVRSGPVGEVISSSQQYITSLVQSLKYQLQRMYDLGMRRLFFVGAAPMGCLPSLRQQSLTKECHAGANYLSAQYNNAVASLLRDMSTQHPDMSYSFLDTSTTLLQYIQQPETNGYAEVKAACCGLGDNNAMFPCTPVSTYCANRTNHMFWDFVHPTEITAQKLTSVAFDGSAPLVTPTNIRQLCAM